MNKYLLETDILVDYLAGSGKSNNYLLSLMQDGMCYTTVLNAGELLFASHGEEEIGYVRNVLDSLKVLGLHSRYALSVKEYSDKTNSLRDSFISVVSSFNKIPIVTFDKERYKKTNLKIIHPKELRV
jgi:predicted nucleic acid-binding protein